MQIIRLHFTTPLHLGGVRAEYDISERVLHSDTMYSAIFQAWQLLGLSHMIPKQSTDDPGFTLSSLFPFYQELKGSPCVYFVPKPMVDLSGDAPPERHKDFKRIEYVEFDLFRKIFFKGKRESDLSHYVNGRFLSEIDVPENFMTTYVNPRVEVPGFDKVGDTKPYYVERIYFAGSSGLYFFIITDTDAIKKAVEAAIRFLQDEGLGTDRHVGNGLFWFDNDDITFDTSYSAPYCTNLSLYCPESREILEEMLQGIPRFEILRRGGWITSQPYKTYRKKRVHMFKEGSIFTVPKNQLIINEGCFVAGKTVDLRPDMPDDMPQVAHPVWRVGRGMFIPVIF